MMPLRATLKIDALRAQRINRAPSPVLAFSVPWLSIALASIVPQWFIIASAPVLPPFGFLAFVAWKQLRPGLLPMWAGLPLGLLDDMVSGQPMGCAVLLWSLAMILLEVLETRFPWRNFALEWLVGGAVVAVYVLSCLAFANMAGGATDVRVIVPQIVISMLLYPLVGRSVAVFDRLRLLPVRSVR